MLPPSFGRPGQLLKAPQISILYSGIKRSFLASSDRREKQAHKPVDVVKYIFFLCSPRGRELLSDHQNV